MAGDQESEEQYEYYMRNQVHLLGKLTIDFHEDPESIECICTRVLLNSKRQPKQKVETIVPYGLCPLIDQITFPAPRIPGRASVKDNGICNNVNEISVDSPINSDDNGLIHSDSDENTGCCGFLKMCQKFRKKIAGKKKQPVGTEEQVAEPTASNQVTESDPESHNLNRETAADVNIENENTTLASFYNVPENGITHLGYAFETPASTSISQISWEYDTNRINRWNAALTLQTPAKLSKPVIDWCDADPNDYGQCVPPNESEDTVEVVQSTKRRRKNKKKSKRNRAQGDDTEPPAKGESDVETSTPPESSSHPELLLPSKTNSEPAPLVDVLMIKTKSILKSTSQENWRVPSAMPEFIASDMNMRKYWNSRYRLFSKFDQGIRLDKESWYSVTPEKVAEHIAERCRCDVIVDAFCGAGGNSIQFAFTCARVIAIDIDPTKIELAKHNANIYGVADRIEFIVGDFFEVAPTLLANVVFLSPPWGGPEYNMMKSFPLRGICPPHGGRKIFDTASTISKHVAYYLPRNINTADLMPLCKPDQVFELEQNFLTNKLVAVTAYFGELPMHE